MAEKIRTFRDPLLRARVVTWLLYASVALSAISVVLHVLRYRLLMQMMNGVLSEAERTAAIGASNLRLETLDHAQAVPAVLVPIAFLMWVYRANGNARALGATGMRFTPGWAVGWYFVPVYNLWRPHQAMAEMWKTSANPLDWRAERTSPLLPWWWVLWIGSGLFAWVAILYGLGAKTFDELLTACLLNTGFDAVEIPLGLLVVAVVGQMTRMQTGGLAGRSEFPGTEPDERPPATIVAPSS